MCSTSAVEKAIDRKNKINIEELVVNASFYTLL